MFRASIAVLLFLSCLSSCSIFRLGSIHFPPPESAPVYTVIYVSPGGNDLNAGNTPDKAVRSISAGITTAVARGVTSVYVQAGVYTSGSGLDVSTSGVLITNSSISLLGGFDPAFSVRSGYSELDGEGTLYHLVLVKKVSNVTIDGFVLRNGNALDVGMDQCGGGIAVTNSIDCSIANIIISNNIAANYGAGICITSSSNVNISNATIVSNSAADGGGIMFNHAVDCSVQNSTINFNFAANYGGGYYNYLSQDMVIRESMILSNTVGIWGGGVIINGSTNDAIFNSSISFNNAKAGSGIYILYSTNTSVYNNALTNNGDTNGVILLHPGITNLTISNNVIGGLNGTAQPAINEMSYNTTGQSIINNIFLTNTLKYIYKDIPGGFINIDSTWTNINATNYTGAGLAYGNTVLP